MEQKINWQLKFCHRQQLWVLVIFFTYSLLSIAFIGCKDKKVSVENSAKKELWTCSMHPEIIREGPGTCPICGMDLIKKEENAVAVNDIQIDDLLQPTDRLIVSSIPMTTIKRKSEPIEMEVLGVIAYDTRLVSTISARVSGRIEKMYVKYRYQHIMKGQRIMDIYSPELLTTQQELLFLIKNDPTNSSLISGAKQKLLLLGMSESQLEQVIRTGKPSLAVAVFSNHSGHIHEAGNTMPGEILSAQTMDISRTTEELPVKEGMYVEKGQNIFQIYNTDRSWVLLNIFPEFQSLIKVKDPVRVIPETAPAKNFRAQILMESPKEQIRRK